MDAIQEHHQKLLAAFGSVLAAEEKISDVKTRLDQVTNLLQAEKTAAETDLASAWEQVEQLMSETGEVEVLLPGAVTDFKIARSNPRETVKVEVEATPDEFCKIERKPRLKEIGEHLKGLRDAGLPFPNWASFQVGTAKLSWKAVKKSMKTQEKVCQEA
ncbi:hypothetical protein [Fimbriiglobus ruber]|uniref:Uncharacterized protein n=1 Tax=Fimbriiglobus ruber TaxID=1908690 RepID=A0A225DEW2_9BACT|nr:hypothetical protein [Fimbriiglobus ruber]OWK34647.1 hypothetical protein FRUB_10618 [Fimbriiglobus ruber]